MLKPGDKAPSFTLPCVLDDRVSELSLASTTTKFVVLFFYPHDFSFVCPTEITGFSKAATEFREAGASIVGLSVDDPESHRRWASELGGVAFPLAADVGGAVAQAYGVFNENDRTALRATFVLDEARLIVYVVASPINVGRSVRETLRVVQALRSGQLCPADWQQGDPTIVPRA